MRLKIALWPALIVLAVVVLTTRLGFWQLSRAHQREALNAHMLAYQHEMPLPVAAISSGGASRAARFDRISPRGRAWPADARAARFARQSAPIATSGLLCRDAACARRRRRRARQIAAGCRAIRRIARRSNRSAPRKARSRSRASRARIRARHSNSARRLGAAYDHPAEPSRSTPMRAKPGAHAPVVRDPAASALDVGLRATGRSRPKGCRAQLRLYGPMVGRWRLPRSASASTRRGVRRGAKSRPRGRDRARSRQRARPTRSARARRSMCKTKTEVELD